MIRTGREYLDSIRDAREVFIDGERVTDLASHPMFAPLVGIRARIYDMQHEAGMREILAYRDDGQEEWHAVANKLPRTQDWWAKRRATDTILESIGGIVFNSPGLKFICRTGFAGRAPVSDYPLANRFDEVEALVIFDNVLIPWENVLFYRHTRAAMFIRATLHRYSAFTFVQRNLKLADMMIGAALFNVRQTGLDKQQAVQEKLAELAVHREGINAHLTASIALAERSPAGLLMPNQSLLLRALRAGVAAGGEAGPIHSAGLLVVREVSWPIVDLRVDWSDDDPVAALTSLWERYEPQLEDYVRRALTPGDAPSFGVPGDL